MAALLFLFTCFASNGSAQSASPEAIVDAFAKAWNSHDGKAIGRLFTDDAIFVPTADVRAEGGSRELEEAFTAMYTTGWMKTTTVVQSDTKARALRPDIAVVLFHSLLKGTLDDQGKLMPDADRAVLFVVVK